MLSHLQMLAAGICPECRGLGWFKDISERGVDRDCFWCKGTGKAGDIPESEQRTMGIKFSFIAANRAAQRSYEERQNVEHD